MIDVTSLGRAARRLRRTCRFGRAIRNRVGSGRFGGGSGWIGDGPERDGPGRAETIAGLRPKRDISEETKQNDLGGSERAAASYRELRLGGSEAAKQQKQERQPRGGNAVTAAAKPEGAARRSCGACSGNETAEAKTGNWKSEHRPQGAGQAMRRQRISRSKRKAMRDNITQCNTYCQA